MEFPLEVPGTPTLKSIWGLDEAENLEAMREGLEIQSENSRWLAPTIQEKLWTPALAGLELAPDDRLLDAGTGLGFHLKGLHSGLLSRLWLLDLSKLALKAAKAEFPGVHLLRRDWCDTKLPDESFKVITGFNADSFTSNAVKLQEFLAEMKRLLVPGGRMAFLNMYVPDVYTWTDYKHIDVPELDRLSKIGKSAEAITTFLSIEERALKDLGLEPHMGCEKKTKWFTVYGFHLEKPLN
jgi:SAM-dependent methyltransferase